MKRDKHENLRCRNTRSAVILILRMKTLFLSGFLVKITNSVIEWGKYKCGGCNYSDGRDHLLHQCGVITRISCTEVAKWKQSLHSCDPIVGITCRGNLISTLVRIPFTLVRICYQDYSRLYLSQPSRGLKTNIVTVHSQNNYGRSMVYQALWHRRCNVQ